MRSAAVALLLLLAACRTLLGFEEPTNRDAGDGSITIAFETAASGADENSASLAIPVVLSAPADVAIQVSIDVAGTAILSSDFTTGPTTLVFAVGETRKDVELSIVADSDESEPNETIELALASASGAAIGAPGTHLVTISNHILPRVQFATATSSTIEAVSTKGMLVLDKPSEGASTIALAVSGTATAGADHTVADNTVIAIPDGATTVTFPIGEVSDALDEDAETIAFALESPSPNLLVGTANASTHTITDDDPEPVMQFSGATTAVAEAGGTSNITVTLSTPSGRTVTADFTRSGAADATDATVTTPGTLTFAAGEISKTITVDILQDTLDEDNEPVILTLSNLAHATLGTSTHTLSINDDDPTPTVSFKLASSAALEANVAVNLVVELSAPSGRTVTVQFGLGSGTTANSPQDFTLAASPLTFPPGTTSANIVVNVVQDLNNENDETVRVQFGQVVNANPGGVTSHILTILDND